MNISLPSHGDIREIELILVATPAEIHVVLLVFDEHVRLIAGMRLVAGKAAHLIERVALRQRNVAYGMILRGMPQAILQRQSRNFTKVVRGQLHLAVEDGHDRRLTFDFLRARVRPVALKT